MDYQEDLVTCFGGLWHWNLKSRHGKSVHPSMDTFCQQLKFLQMDISKFSQLTRISVEIHRLQGYQIFNVKEEKDSFPDESKWSFTIQKYAKVPKYFVDNVCGSMPFSMSENLVKLRFGLTLLGVQKLWKLALQEEK